MPVKIRLQRHGSKKRPFYFIVVADARSPRDGKFILAVAGDQAEPEALAAPQIQVVINWFEDLKQRTAAK